MGSDDEDISEADYGDSEEDGEELDDLSRDAGEEVEEGGFFSDEDEL